MSFAEIVLPTVQTCTKSNAMLVCVFACVLVRSPNFGVIRERCVFG